MLSLSTLISKLSGAKIIGIFKIACFSLIGWFNCDQLKWAALEKSWFSGRRYFSRLRRQISIDYIKTAPPPNLTLLLHNTASYASYLRNEPHNKPFSIISDSQFTEANKALNSFLKSLSKSGQICSTVHSSTVQFYRETPQGVFSTKNHQGGLDGTDDPSDGKMFEGKGFANCPVAVVKAYLSHLNPECQSLFQKPLTGAKIKPSSDVIWYSIVPLGHNTIESMMKNMCLRSGIDPPFTNRCVRSTALNILSSKDMKNRHIRAVTGHKSDASLESYNDRPTFEQFKNMSSAITDFINFCRPDHQVAINPLAEVNRSPLETVSKAIHSSTSTNVQENIFVQENMSTNAAHELFLVAPSPTARSTSTLRKLWKRILDVFFFSPDY